MGSTISGVDEILFGRYLGFLFPSSSPVSAST